jgi:hypothetical protein
VHVFSLKASRLARNGRDWHHLLELCGLVDGRAVKKYGHARPQDAWTVLLRDHHEGYISWEQYERNQERIQKNAYSKPAGDAKSGRGGPALLSSLLSCRRCGRMLRVTYNGHYAMPRYSCKRRTYLYCEKYARFTAWADGEARLILALASALGGRPRSAPDGSSPATPSWRLSRGTVEDQ